MLELPISLYSDSWNLVVLLEILHEKKMPNYWLLSSTWKKKKNIRPVSEDGPYVNFLNSKKVTLEFVTLLKPGKKKWDAKIQSLIHS